VKQQQQQRASAGMGAARAQHQHSAPTVKAAASGAGRLDSWDLDDDALPNGSFSTQQGEVADMIHLPGPPTALHWGLLQLQINRLQQHYKHCTLAYHQV
jgi:hypothetical protein